MILPFRTAAEVAAAIPDGGGPSGGGRAARLSDRDGVRAGLGARRARRSRALARLKGRPPRQAVPAAGRRAARWRRQWGLVFNASARALADAFWPGPLTLVLPGGEGRLPDELRGRGGRHRGAAHVARRHRALVIGPGHAAHLHLGQPARAAAGAGRGPDRRRRSPRRSRHRASCWCSTAGCWATCRRRRWSTAPVRCRAGPRRRDSARGLRRAVGRGWLREVACTSSSSAPATPAAVRWPRRSCAACWTSAASTGSRWRPPAPAPGTARRLGRAPIWSALEHGLDLSAHRARLLTPRAGGARRPDPHHVARAPRARGRAGRRGQGLPARRVRRPQPAPRRGERSLRRRPRRYRDTFTQLEGTARRGGGAGSSASASAR